MANLVNHSVTNLINGVSEQAPSVRLDNQLEEQENCFSDVTRGLTRRNGLELKNITQLDIDNTFKIPFTIDGTRHMVALDANHATTPLQYVPLSTDVDALAVSSSNLEYFKDMSRNDLQILEDKEKVYLLNRKQVVGDGNAKSTYFNIKLIRESDYTTPTLWDIGEYSIQLDGVADPTTANVAVGTVTVNITRATTLQNIADAINTDADFIAEAGQCTVTGTISNFRIIFTAIPSGWILPDITTAVITPITEPTLIDTDTPWRLDPLNFVNKNNGAYIWDGAQIGISTAGTLDVGGGVKYHIGAGGYIAGPFNTTIFMWSIRESTQVPSTLGYILDVTTPSGYQEDGEGVIPHADEGMIWVTGVASNQTYDTVITYYQLSVPSTPLTTTIPTTSVGTTLSNIKLNWVATDIQTNVNAETHFTATVHDNAVHVSAVAGYAISKIEVTNNYDISSIQGIAEAVQNNTVGLQTIDTLPPIFVDGFAVRVSPSTDDKTNYYMRYDSEFKGWKETALDVTRFLDRNTMPYVIDKNKVKETGIVLIEPSNWENPSAGDGDSNKEPSFVGRTINDIFFYGSRLGFATDDTLVSTSALIASAISCNVVALVTLTVTVPTPTLGIAGSPTPSNVKSYSPISQRVGVVKSDCLISLISKKVFLALPSPTTAFLFSK